MRYLTNQEETKAVDRYSIEQIGIPSIVLMERAALCVAEEAASLVEKDRLILAVCGVGNNGADGIAAARILHGMGYRTEIAVTGNKEHATEEWLLQYEIIRRLGIPIRNKYPDGEYTDRERPGLILDAVFGVGLSREIEGSLRVSGEQINREGCPVLSVDIASGIHSSTGKVLGCAVTADVTVTFGCQKLGQVFYPGSSHSGKVLVKDIGFPMESLEEVKPQAFTWEPSDLKRIPKRPFHSHKGTFGKVLVIAGQKNMAGAAVLSARAAYRMGAGLVQVMTVEENRIIIQEKLPEAVLTTYSPETFTIECMKEPCGWADVIIIGPGMGKESHVRSMLNYIFQYTSAAVVIDADGLNVMAENPAIMDLIGGRTIVTPHVGEMSRLCGEDGSRISENLVYWAKSFASGKNVVCVLKDEKNSGGQARRGSICQSDWKFRDGNRRQRGCIERGNRRLAGCRAAGFYVGQHGSLYSQPGRGSGGNDFGRAWHDGGRYCRCHFRDHA